MFLNIKMKKLNKVSPHNYAEFNGDTLRLVGFNGLFYIGLWFVFFVLVVAIGAYLNIFLGGILASLLFAITGNPFKYDIMIIMKPHLSCNYQSHYRINFMETDFIIINNRLFSPDSILVEKVNTEMNKFENYYGV